MHAPISGYADGVRRVAFTILALVALVLVTQAGHARVVDYWCSLDHGAVDDPVITYALQNPGTQGMVVMLRDALWPMLLWWLIPSLLAFPWFFLAIADHNSPAKAMRDRKLLIAGALIFGTVLAAVLLGDRNGMPVASDQELQELMAVQLRLPGVRMTEQVTAAWLAIPVVLTAMYIVYAARRKTVRWDAFLVDDE